MTYENFISVLTEKLQAKMENDTQIKIHKILKNNHVQLDGLAFHNSNNQASPTIYINDYFIQYEEGDSIEIIVQEIYSLYENNKDTLHFDIEFIKDFNNIKQRIAYKIINYDSNPELLENIPHKKFLDLAIVYYLILGKDIAGNMTTLIQNQHLDFWNVDIHTIHKLSEYNTPLLLPYTIRDMEDVLTELLLEDMKNEEAVPLIKEAQDTSNPMYVLTNDIGINGAACMLYDDILSEAAKKIGSDLIILPSSIHEILLVPRDSEISLKEFVEMVSDINETTVEPEDRLSNQVYLYSLENNSITLASADSMKA